MNGNDIPMMGFGATNPNRKRPLFSPFYGSNAGLIGNQMQNSIRRFSLPNLSNLPQSTPLGLHLLQQRLGGQGAVPMGATGFGLPAGGRAFGGTGGGGSVARGPTGQFPILSAPIATPPGVVPAASPLASPVATTTPSVTAPATNNWISPVVQQSSFPSGGFGGFGQRQA